MGGDLDRAVQLLLTRAEMGQDIKPNQSQVNTIKEWNSDRYTIAH